METGEWNGMDFCRKDKDTMMIEKKTNDSRANKDIAKEVCFKEKGQAIIQGQDR